MIDQCNRRLVADRPVGTFLIIVFAPILHFFPGVCKAQKPMCIQTFGLEATVERLDEGVVGGLDLNPCYKDALAAVRCLLPVKNSRRAVPAGLAPLQGLAKPVCPGVLRPRGARRR